MNRVLVPIILFASLTGGCANFSPLIASRQLKPGSSYWLAYDSTRRGAYVSTTASGEIRACSEPAPDSVYSFVNKLEGAAKTTDLDASAKAELSATAMQLAGRDRTVLATREALFRLCEAQANGDLRPGEYFDGFQEIMYTVRAMVEVERAEAVKDISKSSPKAAEDVAKTFSMPPSTP